MSNTKSELGQFAGVIGVFGAIYLLWQGVEKVLKIKKTSDVGKNLIVDIKDFALNPPSFNLHFTNPTNKSINITKPVIEVFVNNKSVAYSNASNEKYTIKPLSNISIRISPKMRQLAFWTVVREIWSGEKRVDYSLYADGFFVKGSKNLS